MKAQKLYMILIVLCGFASQSSYADVVCEQSIQNVAESAVFQTNTQRMDCVISTDITELFSSRGATESRTVQKTMSANVGNNILFRSDIKKQYPRGTFSYLGSSRYYVFGMKKMIV